MCNFFFFFAKKSHVRIKLTRNLELIPTLYTAPTRTSNLLLMTVSFTVTTQNPDNNNTCYTLVKSIFLTRQLTI